MIQERIRTSDELDGECRGVIVNSVYCTNLTKLPENTRETRIPQPPLGKTILYSDEATLIEALIDEGQETY